MSDTIIIRRNGEKFAVDCSTVLEAFNGHLKVKFDGIICPKCGASDSCWIPVRKVEDDGDRTVKLYEVDFKDGYSMVIMGRRKPNIDEANAFLPGTWPSEAVSSPRRQSLSPKKSIRSLP